MIAVATVYGGGWSCKRDDPALDSEGLSPPSTEPPPESDVPNSPLSLFGPDTAPKSSTAPSVTPDSWGGEGGVREGFTYP